MKPPRLGVLFVCLGNICRSPLAEAVFRDVARRRGWSDLLEIDSCGTGGWHCGDRADPRTLAVAARHGLEVPHLARQWDAASDPLRFDYIIPQDRANFRQLQRSGLPSHRLRLMRSFDPALSQLVQPGLHGEGYSPELDVPDPYYGSDDGFERVYHLLVAACEGLADEIARRGSPFGDPA